ncbi:TIR domain-containing protein [Psychrilyobacter atlanticus]|uniref:TIR domain-containing protein n=1 Tax=Psychrilyobacter atlanticus TaxID=271091 RepID=UPI000403D507|nr:TIR domain-containing protein [Psychrilyobacter atlanticus]
MAKKTFISYKYSEAQELRDKIIIKLGDASRFYTGETSESPSLDDVTTETIKEKLKDMIYNTSVTILIISPQMNESKWIPWEISYSLKEIKRGDKKSRTNGIVGVIMKDDNGKYDWFRSSVKADDGCNYTYLKTDKIPKIIRKNMFNEKSPKYTCECCKTVNRDTGHFISLYEEDTFLALPADYIEPAFNKKVKDYIISRDL